MAVGAVVVGAGANGVASVADGETNGVGLVDVRSVGAVRGVGVGSLVGFAVGGGGAAADRRDKTAPTAVPFDR